MITLLYGVAATLIAAGVAAVFFGADNIRAESGSAWLQSGATMLASGALLVAFTAVLAELRRIRRQLAEMALEVHDVAVAPATPLSREQPTSTAHRTGDPRDQAGMPAASLGQASHNETFASLPEAPATSVSALHEADAAPLAGAALSLQEWEVGTLATALVAPTIPQHGSPCQDASEPATIVGTYAAGQSTYVMYSDGTIEAETTEGRYRFPSMADLRHFIETGDIGRGAPSPATSPSAALAAAERTG